MGHAYRDEEANQDDNSPSHSRDTNGETEPWIKVTDEDVAQAKEATEYNDNSNNKATTDTQISCWYVTIEYRIIFRDIVYLIRWRLGLFYLMYSLYYMGEKSQTK